MTDTHLKMQLEKATLDLDKTTDVEGILIVASDGRILHHNLRVDVDMNLFGPMSQVISNSSHRLLNSSGQGEMERVLVESSGGKALFLGLDKAHLIILMQDTANVGLILVNAKRASQKIDEATQDLVLEVPEEIPEKVPEEVPEEVVEEIPELAVEEVQAEEVATEEEYPVEIPFTEEIVSEEVKEKPLEAETGLKADEVAVEIQEEPTDEHVEELPEKPVEKPIEESLDDLTEERIEISEETVQSVTESAVTEQQLEVESESESAKIGELKEVGLEKEPETVETALEEVEEEKVEEAKPSIPTVKPPISFPSLPEHVEVPDDPEKRSELILDIYEKIFLAMSMGAAKIMGVAPARGLTKKFLPFEKCQRLLQNVDLKSNATIDFAQIKKNAAEIPVEEREKIFIKDFSRMIEIITENYGRVMGYEAFRGMVRAEFLAINKSYGEAMDNLNIKQNMHPEISILFA